MLIQKHCLIKTIIAILVIIILLPLSTYAAACRDRGYTIVYVNGILTGQDSAIDQKIDLKNLVPSEVMGEPIDVKLGYNPSHLAGLGDLTESASQLLGSSISNYDRNTILLQLYPEITTRKILLVGHSQGTFYTNEIYNYLLANGEQKDAVGVYNVATPASSVAGDGAHLTSENDKVINSVRDVASKIKAKQPLPANITIPLTSSEANDKFGGHSFGEVYLAGASGRIVSEISDSLKKLLATEVTETTDVGCFTPPPRDISYYTQKVVFAVADPAATGAVVAGKTTIATGKIAYNGALAAVQSAVKVAEIVYTNAGKLSTNVSHQGLALITNFFGNSNQQNNDAVLTNSNSEDGQIETSLASSPQESNFPQLALSPEVNTENKLSITSQESLASLEVNTTDSDGFDQLTASTTKEKNAGPQHDSSSTEPITPEKNPDISGSGRSGGGSAPPTGGVSVVQTSPTPAQPVFLVITEIMYDTPGADSGHEWVEIFNNGTSTADITQLKFFENGTNHKLNTAQGSSTLTSGSYAVLTDDSLTFLSDYPNYVDQLFDSSFSLSNSSETIAIKNGDAVVNEITYSSSTGANGDGNSLQLINGSWQATSPTPGKENKVGNKPPIALFKFSPASPEASGTISFDASSSTDPDGSIVSYSWNFGDGQSTITNQSTTTYSYSSVGSYLVELTPFDNSGSSSTATSTISVASSSNSSASSSSQTSSESNHILISEILFNASGTDVGKEFVELYNPNATSTDLSGWSLKYQKENSTSTTSLASFKTSSNPEDQTVIQPKGFLLIGLNDYDLLNYGGKSADIKRTVALSNGEIDGQAEKIYIILSNSSSSEIDKISYDKNSITSDGQSLERKAFQSGACVSSQNNVSTSLLQGEFLGNGCDTNDAGDFEIRNSPNPQNSGSFPEPRSAPTINNFQVFYDFTPRFDFSWNLSGDSTGATSGITYFIYDSSNPSSTDLIFETSSTASLTFTYPIDEVDRDYNFQFKVQDRDGLSAVATSTVTANSLPELNPINTFDIPPDSYTGQTFYIPYDFTGVLKISVHTNQNYGTRCGWPSMGGTTSLYRLSSPNTPSSKTDLINSTSSQVDIMRCIDIPHQIISTDSVNLTAGWYFIYFTTTPWFPESSVNLEGSNFDNMIGSAWTSPDASTWNEKPSNDIYLVSSGG